MTRVGGEFGCAWWVQRKSFEEHLVRPLCWCAQSCSCMTGTKAGPWTPAVAAGQGQMHAEPHVVLLPHGS